MQGIGRDIRSAGAAERALRASEERFRALVENSTDAVIVLDRGGSLVFENPSRERPLGYAPGESMGVSVFDIFHPEDVARARDVFAEAVARPGVAVRASFRCRHKDGTWRHIESTFRSLLDNPAVGGVVVNSRDVTEETLRGEAAPQRDDVRDGLAGGGRRARGAQPALRHLGHARRVRGALRRARRSTQVP